MSYAERLRKEWAKSNNRPTMPFGKHKGLDLAEVPSSYYCWLLYEGAVYEPLLTLIKEQLIMRGVSYEEYAQRMKDKEERKKQASKKKKESQEQHGDSAGFRYEPDPFYRPIEEEIPTAKVEEVVRKWYTKLCKRYHPDRGGSDIEQRVINEARDTLNQLLREEGLIGE